MSPAADGVDRAPDLEGADLLLVLRLLFKPLARPLGLCAFRKSLRGAPLAAAARWSSCSQVKTRLS